MQNIKINFQIANRRKSTDLSSRVEWNLRATSNLNSNNTTQLHFSTKQTVKQSTNLIGWLLIRKNRSNNTSSFFQENDQKIEERIVEYLIEVSVRKDRELFLDWLQEPNGDVKAVVGAVSKLLRVFNGSERTTGLRLLVKGPRRVPSEKKN